MIDLSAALVHERNCLTRSYKRDTSIIVALLVGYTAFIALLIYLYIIASVTIIKILLILGIISTGIGLIFGVVLLSASSRWHHADLSRLDDIEKGENSFEDQVSSLIRYNASVAISAITCGMTRPIIYVTDDKFTCHGKDKFYPSLDIWKQLLECSYSGGPLIIQDGAKTQLYGFVQKDDILHVYFANILGNVIYHADFDVETDYIPTYVGTFAKIPYKYSEYEYIFSEELAQRDLLAFMSDVCH